MRIHHLLVALGSVSAVAVGVACTGSEGDDAAGGNSAVRRVGETTDTSDAFDPEDCPEMLQAATKAVEGDLAAGKVTKWVLSKNEIACLSAITKLEPVNVNNAAVPNPNAVLLKALWYTARLGAGSSGALQPLPAPGAANEADVTSCNGKPIAQEYPNLAGVSVKRATAITDRQVCIGALRDLNQWIDKKPKFIDFIKDNVELLVDAEGTVPSFSADRRLKLAWNTMQSEAGKKSVVRLFASNSKLQSGVEAKQSIKFSEPTKNVNYPQFRSTWVSLAVSQEYINHVPEARLCVQIDKLARGVTTQYAADVALYLERGAASSNDPLIGKNVEGATPERQCFSLSQTMNLVVRISNGNHDSQSAEGILSYEVSIPD